ncbi:AbrB/MazE/SpoVT family DNA-binding domain-containing protein [Natronorubrum sp. DTA7]|uniref:AbrB/MazE/SpoVT family DNA-binding domain-containing protein n=1 Tax=Natronorubrum sp. DTA7 TaxID=3447016 RepID=UPI003F872487
MSKSESSSDSEKEVVAVSKHGQATIPKRFREKLEIDAPGKVLFRETEDGDVIVERVRSASEMQGFAARSEASTDVPATELLREKRERDRSDRDDRFPSK